MKGPSDYIKIFYCDCKIKLARAMEFRFDFIMGLLLSFSGSFINVLFQFLIYTKTRGFPGWNFNQVLLFQAVVLLAVGIRDTIFGNVRPVFEEYIQYGNMDRILLFPFPSLGIILMKGFQLSTMPSVLAGLITLIYSMVKLNLTVTWWQILAFLMFILVGIILYLALIILHCALTLKFIYVQKLREVFDRLISFSYYPAEIFTGIFKTAYLTILPIAVFAYFPAQVLLGRLPGIWTLGTGMSLALFYLAVTMWHIQLRNYTGAGG